MKVYFYEDYFDGNIKTKELGNYDTFNESTKCIAEFLKEHDYKWERMVLNFLDIDNTIQIDVGSHTKFFRVVCRDKFEYNVVMNELRNNASCAN